MQTNPERLYCVEGHGDSVLRIEGGQLRSYGHTREPYLTKREAWEMAKEWAATSEYHTIKICRGCTPVCTMFRQVSGGYFLKEADRMLA